ncbi:MAG: pre-peptidase C-terminal domain-containing protein, partial [Chloroflexota bacterium]
TDDENNVGIIILQNGDVINDVFEEGARTRIYGFNATEGDQVTIKMTQVDDLDPFLVLLGPRGEVIAQDDDGGEVNLSSEIQVTLPSSGGYLIFASTFFAITTVLDSDVEGVSGFELSIEGITAPTDLDDFDPMTIAYFSGTAPVGGSTEGSSTLQEPVFYYTLEAEEGQVYDITLESDDFDTVLHVFGQNGDRIAVNDDDPLGSTTDSAITDLVIPVTGKYVIFATDLFFYNAIATEIDEESVLNYSGGTFTLTISEPTLAK